jgi:O-antigen/teichoic acid export membrane protein
VADTRTEQTHATDAAGSLTARTARAGLWTVGGKFASKLIDFVTLIVLTRLLTPADFGLVAMAMTAVFIVEAITEVPLSTALLRVAHPSRAMFQTAFTIALLRGGVVLALLALVSVPLSMVFERSELVALTCTLALAPTLRGLVSPGMARFARNLDFSREFLLDVVAKACSLTIAVGVGLLTGSYWALAAATITSSAALMVVSYVIAPIRPRLTLAEWSQFRDLVTWSTASQFFSAINWQLDRLIMPKFATAAQFGSYVAAGDLTAIPHQALVQPLSRPMMAALGTAGQDVASLRRKHLMFSRAFVILLVPILLFLAAASDLIVGVVFGTKWSMAALMLFWLALIAAIGVMALPVAALAMTTHNTHLNAVRLGVELSVKAPLMIIGAYAVGIPGVLASQGAAAVAGTAVAIHFVWRMIGVPALEQLGNVALPVVAALVPFLAIEALADVASTGLWPNIVRIVALAAIYFAAYGTLLMLGSVLLAPADAVERRGWRMLLSSVQRLLARGRTPESTAMTSTDAAAAAPVAYPANAGRPSAPREEAA